MKPDYDLSIAFSDSFSLIKKQPRRVLIWGLLLVFVPLILLVPFGIWALPQLVQGMDGPQTLWEIMMQETLGNLFSFGQYLVAIPIVGAVVRYILDKPGPSRFAGLRFSMDELWVFVCYVALGLGATVMMLGVFLIALLGAFLARAGDGSVIGIVLVGLFALACFAVLIWVSIRFSMLIPASIDLNNLAFGPAWRASKGRFWPLFGTGILSALIVFGTSVLWFALLALVVLILALIGGVTGLVSFDGPAESLAWVWLVVVGGILMLAPTAYLSGIWVVLYSGPYASAWQQLRPRPLAAEPHAFERM